MRKDLRWVFAFIIMIFLGIGVATATSTYLSALLNPVKFIYAGNAYMETRYEISTDMEHKTNSTYLYDFSGHSPNRDLKIPTLQGPVTLTGRYGDGYKWAFPNNRAINGTDLGIISGSFTIEAWLNPKPLPIPDPTISWTGLPNEVNIRRLLIAPNGSAWAQMTDPLVNFYSNTALPMDSWTHVAFVYDSDAGRISWIINGTLDRTSEPGYTSGWSGEFKIGGWTDSEIYRWNGKIDEFRIRNQALLASQVAADMNRPIRKIVRITALTPNVDQASLALESGGIPREVTADANGNADLDTFGYGDFFEGYFTAFHGSLTVQSETLRLHTGDEYQFSLTSYLSPNLVYVAIVIAFPLGTAVAYLLKRATSKKSSTK